MDKIDTVEEASSGTDIIKTWKLVYTYAQASSASGRLFDNEDVAKHLMTKFWSLYDPAVTSIWAMKYSDPAKQHKIKTVKQAKDIVTTLMTDKQMVTTMQHDCFGIVHILEHSEGRQEIQGLWFLNGPDPEPLFATNAEARAYNWKQLAPHHYHFGLLGPDVNEFIKGAVAGKFTPPAEHAERIIDTQIF
jgi:hypothetical protein